MHPTDHPSLLDPSIPPLDHEQAISYLPWLPQEDLEPDIRRRLLAHLDLCATCRQELLYLSELRAALDFTALETDSPTGTPPLDVEASLASVMRRIDHAQASPPAPNPADPSRVGRGQRPLRSHRSTWALAAALILAVMAGFMLRPLLFGPVPGTVHTAQSTTAELVPGTFTTLSDSREEPVAASATEHATQLSVAFQPDTSITRIQAILGVVDGQIVGGPSALGVLSVALIPNPEAANGGALERALSTLRAQPETTFVEPRSTVMP